MPDGEQAKRSSHHKWLLEPDAGPKGALLGASWLVLKSDGELHDWAYRRVSWLAAGVFIVLFLAFALTFDYSIFARNNLQTRAWGIVFPAIGALALGVIFWAGAHRRRGTVPFMMAVLFFLAAFISLAVMFWPYMIPYSVTVASAAAPDPSLQFFLYAGVVVLPIIAVYTMGVYWVFRGKIREGYGVERKPDSIG